MSHRILCADPDDAARAETIDEITSQLADLDLHVETAGTLAAVEGALTRETALAADGRIEVRSTDDGGEELRIRGLRNQPNGWQSLTLP